MITRFKGWALRHERVSRPMRRRPARRVSLQWQANVGLRGDERRLAAALSQLRQGVPLSWSQVEDDDALATLHFLQSAAGQITSQPGNEVTDELRQAAFADLDALLPQPKPVVVKEAPKSLAGFSERVQVLTQVEEDVPSLVSKVPQWIAACALAAVGVAFLFWAIGGSAQAVQGPQFRWIELHSGEEQISRVVDRTYWTETPCVGFSLNDPKAYREFISLPDAKQLQAASSFPVLYPLLDLPVPGTEVTHTFRLVGSGLSPCAGPAPDTSDQGAMVRLEYLSYSRTPEGRRNNLTRFKVIEARRIPMHLDVSSSEWQEVQTGEMRGVYWQDSRYRDIEGRIWTEGARGLLVEDEERTLMIIAEADEGIDKELLIALAASVGTGSPTDVAGYEEFKVQSSRFLVGEPLFEP